MKLLVTESCLTLFNPRTVACQAPLSMEFSRQKYWSGLPFPTLRDLPNPEIKPRSPALQADSLLSESPGNTLVQIDLIQQLFVDDLICYIIPLKNQGETKIKINKAKF